MFKRKFKNRITITEKFIFYFLIIYLIVISGVITIVYYQSKNALLDRTFQQLISLKHSKKRQIESFFIDRTKEVDNVIHLITLREKMRGSVKDIDVNFILKSFASNYFDGYYLFDNKTKKLVSNSTSDQNDVSNSLVKLISDKEAVQIHDFIKNSDSNSYAIYFESTFIINSDKFTVFYRLPYGHIERIIYENDPNQGLGLSGESYIVGKDYLMRSESRFIPNSLMRTIVFTESSRKALRGISGTVTTKDYRNIEVLSSFTSLKIKDLTWILVTEIDMEEAVKPIIAIKGQLLSLVLFLSILIFVITYALTRKITKPLILLTEAANKLAQNKQTEKLVQFANDEIGDLTASFNYLSDNLKKKDEELNQERLKRFSSVVDAQEREKERLSKELHDGLGQMFVALKLKLEAIEDAELAASTIEEVKDGLDDTIDEIRTISNNLMPSVLKEIGLAPAIKNLCSNLTKISGIVIDLEYENIDENMNQMKKIYIFRVIQEALNNIIKHSGAASAKIIFHNDENTIKIIDDGIGFDTANTKFGNGIYNMKERILSLNGKMSIFSEPGKGTVILIELA